MVTRRHPMELGGDDQLVFLHDVTWGDYVRIAELRGESAVPRLTYCDGTLELMSPGFPHETDKKKLARIFEAYVEQLGIEAEGIGSWTVKQKRKKRGAEADECYVFAPVPVDESVKCPDLVIEVMYRSGGLDKLDVWNALGAKEVWFWTRERELHIYVRKGKAFVERNRSALVPAVDPGLLVRCMNEPSQGAAVRLLRKTLSGDRRSRGAPRR